MFVIEYSPFEASTETLTSFFTDVEEYFYSTPPINDTWSNSFDPGIASLIKKNYKQANSPSTTEQLNIVASTNQFLWSQQLPSVHFIQSATFSATALSGLTKPSWILLIHNQTWVSLKHLLSLLAFQDKQFIYGSLYLEFDGNQLTRVDPAGGILFHSDSISLFAQCEYHKGIFLCDTDRIKPFPGFHYYSPTTIAKNILSNQIRQLTSDETRRSLWLSTAVTHGHCSPEEMKGLVHPPTTYPKLISQAWNEQLNIQTQSYVETCKAMKGWKHEAWDTDRIAKEVGRNFAWIFSKSNNYPKQRISDIFRIYLIYTRGGVVINKDVTCLDFTSLLSRVDGTNFFAVYASEHRSPGLISNAVIGSTPFNPEVLRFLKYLHPIQGRKNASPWLVTGSLPLTLWINTFPELFNHTILPSLTYFPFQFCESFKMWSRTKDYYIQFKKPMGVQMNPCP